MGLARKGLVIFICTMVALAGIAANLESGAWFLPAGRLWPRRSVFRVGPRLALHASLPEIGERIRFLPALDYESEELQPGDGARVLPCAPCEGHVFLPGSKPMTCVTEPRYREMYNDILVSGARRFVVPFYQRDELTGQVHLAEVGAVFHLDDLKEVSEETEDRVKFVCYHSVTSRVRLSRVLNPQAFKDASTYLRVEVEALEEVNPGANDMDMVLEHYAKHVIHQVSLLQASLNFETRFRDPVLRGMDVSRGRAFWYTAGVWANYALELEADRIEKQLYEYPTFKDSDEYRATRSRLENEAKPRMLAVYRCIQELLQSESHRERLELFVGLAREEERRLQAKMALKQIFAE